LGAKGTSWYEHFQRKKSEVLLIDLAFGHLQNAEKVSLKFFKQKIILCLSKNIGINFFRRNFFANEFPFRQKQKFLGVSSFKTSTEEPFLKLNYIKMANKIRDYTRC